jgi:hypothetical protein
MFSRKQPLATSCEQGVGAIQALRDLIPILFWLFVAVGIGSLFIGGTPATILVMLVGLLSVTIFSAYAWHYPFPYATPLIPECLPREVLAVLQLANTTFPPFFENLIVAENAEQCTVVIFDCKAVGLFNGFDYFLAIMQSWFPDWMETFYNSFGYSILALVPVLKTSLDRAHFPGGLPPTAQTCINFIGFLAIFQMFAILAIGYILGVLLLNIVANLLSRLGDVGIAGVVMLDVVSEDSDIQLIT